MLIAALSLPYHQGSGKNKVTLRTGDGQQPSASHWRTALMRSAAAARAARVVSGSSWEEWSFPDRHLSRSLERTPSHYSGLVSDKRWRGTNRPLIPAPVSGVLTDDDWRVIARALSEGGKLNQLACRHALSLLTGNWWLPDESLWRLGQSGTWSCPKCGETRPSTPHLVSCGTGTSEARWYQRLTPSSMDCSLTTLGRRHRDLTGTVNKLLVKMGTDQQTGYQEADTNLQMATDD